MAGKVTRQELAQILQDELNILGANNVRYGVATGTANTYSVAFTPAITAYVEGLALSVKINVDSTGASTINVDGLGAVGIKNAMGVDVTNLKANGIYTMRYDGTNFMLQGEGVDASSLITTTNNILGM